MNQKLCQVYTTLISLFVVVIPSINCHQNSKISVCPGEGPRYGDFKCIHDRTHRVCAKLVDNPTSCSELSWNGNGASFWDITGQQRWNWKDKICSAPNPGDSWCICMWATANLIKEVGCDNVHINCPATDVSHVMSSYNDGGWNLKEAKDCLQRKCILQNDGNYVNAGSGSSSSKSQNTHSNSALTSEDSKINIPQPSFESGSLKIQNTQIITILMTLALIFGS